MHVHPLTPRGYCHGVVSALGAMRRLARDSSYPRPIHILGLVVHNRKIVQDLEDLGFIVHDDTRKKRIELLDEIDGGTVVFTAHGVPEEVYGKACRKGLSIVDTTCEDVKRSQMAIKNALAEGKAVAFIGKAGHPESETARSFGADVHLVETVEDARALEISKPLALTNQTTMSFYDVYSIAEAVRSRYPDVDILDEICDATRARQEAVKNQPDVDLCLVVGDPRSNNTRKLAETAERHGVPARRIGSVEDIDIDWLKGVEHISVTSGASTPTPLTKEVIRFLEAFDPDDPATHETKSHKKLENLFQ